MYAYAIGQLLAQVPEDFWSTRTHEQFLAYDRAAIRYQQLTTSELTFEDMVTYWLSDDEDRSQFREIPIKFLDRVREILDENEIEYDRIRYFNEKMSEVPRSFATQFSVF